MASAVAASTFASSILQRTTVQIPQNHLKTSRHTPLSSGPHSHHSIPTAIQGPSIIGAFKKGASRTEKLRICGPTAGVSFLGEEVSGLGVCSHRRRLRGSKKSTVCSVAGVGAGEASREPAKEADPLKSTFGSKLRAIVFYTATIIIAIPLFVIMVIIFPFQLLFDRHRRRALHLVNNLWANATTALFYKIDVIGAENLPPKDTPAIYIANHQSYLDIFSLFRLWVPFKFISKTSNFLIPIVGWSMFLTGHIPIKRLDARSQAKCLKACREMLERGGPLLFFPEGTRSLDQKLAGFKKGAFSVAVKAKVPIVPITLIGTGNLMPSGKEGSLHAGGVKIIVHPPMSDTDPDQLMKDSREVIQKTLIEYGAE